MWSPLHLSRPSSTSTTMCTRAMIGSPWSLGGAQAHYVSSCEALWCLNLFAMQEHHPTVVHLQVHLPDQQSIIFSPEGGSSIQDVVESHRNKDSTQLSVGGLLGPSLPRFPLQDGLEENQHKWTHRSLRRNDGFAIGRMYHAHSTSGEHFYLCLLLTWVKGAVSFDDLCTVDGVHTPWHFQGGLFCTWPLGWWQGVSSVLDKGKAYIWLWGSNWGTYLSPSCVSALLPGPESCGMHSSLTSVMTWNINFSSRA